MAPYPETADWMPSAGATELAPLAGLPGLVVALKRAFKSEDQLPSRPRVCGKQGPGLAGQRQPSGAIRAGGNDLAGGRRIGHDDWTLVLRHK